MKKKYIVGVVLVVLSIVIITIFAISASAENATTAIAKEIEDEKTLVKMAASLSRGNNIDGVVDKDLLVEQLNIYAGSGETSVTEKTSDILVVTFLESGKEYEISVDTGKVSPTELPSTKYTTPYLPTGFTYMIGTDLDTGIVIQDSLGNQYVWIEVPRDLTVYPNAGLDITTFTDTEYTKIENDLNTYTSIYRNSTSVTDIYYSDETTGLTSNEYYELKKKMLKSVYQNGGFYIGRYETGISYSEGARMGSGTTTQTPVITANAYPYTWLTCVQAQSLASTKFQTGGHITSLMFGVQWNLVLKYLETKGAIQHELNLDSTKWGNYSNKTYNITNENAKYYKNSIWLSAPYNKTSSDPSLLTTGASSEFCKQGIYDLAGNAYEWTLEYTKSVIAPCTNRGGNFYLNGSTCPASGRGSFSTTDVQVNFGFRVTLY